VLSVVILFAWFSDRSRSELLWLAALLACSAVEMLNQFVLTRLDSRPWDSVIPEGLVALALPTTLLAEFLLAALWVRPHVFLRLLIWFPSALSLVGFWRPE
jgi:hypothetical protein